MKGIAYLYTCFWTLYYPLCIAFAKPVGFDYSDELLTVVVIVYACVQQHQLVKSGKRWKEIRIWFSLTLFYLLYSLVIGITTTKGILIDLVQQVRPYAIFYLTWMLAPRFTRWQKRWLLGVMLVSMATYIVVFMSNYNLLIKGKDEDVIIGHIAINTAMVYYLFTKRNARNRYIALGIMTLGLIGGKSKYIGECVVFFSLVLFSRKKPNLRSPKLLLRLAAVAAVVIFFTWTKFNAYYVEGMINEDKKMARPESYKTAVKIIFRDYIPFGTGYGTFGTFACTKEYSPIYYKYEIDQIWGLTPENAMFLADAFYPTLAQVGLFGIFFFGAFWRRRIVEAWRIQDMVTWRMAIMAIMALALESTADTSYLSGRGMGYFMVLALCLNENVRNRRVYVQKIIPKKSIKHKQPHELESIHPTEPSTGLPVG